MTHDPNDPEILKAALSQALDRASDLERQLHEARTHLAHLRGCHAEEEQRRFDAETQLERCQEALTSALNYAHHIPGCDYRGGEGICDCGLRDLEREARSTQPQSSPSSTPGDTEEG